MKLGGAHLKKKTAESRKWGKYAVCDEEVVKIKKNDRLTVRSKVWGEKPGGPSHITVSTSGIYESSVGEGRILASRRPRSCWSSIYLC